MTAPNPVKKVPNHYEPFCRTLHKGNGVKARALFDLDALPWREAQIRNRLRREGLWLR